MCCDGAAVRAASAAAGDIAKPAAGRQKVSPFGRNAKIPAVLRFQSRGVLWDMEMSDLTHLTAAELHLRAALCRVAADDALDTLCRARLRRLARWYDALAHRAGPHAESLF